VQARIIRFRLVQQFINKILDRDAARVIQKFRRRVEAQKVIYALLVLPHGCQLVQWVTQATDASRSQSALFEVGHFQFHVLGIHRHALVASQQEGAVVAAMPHDFGVERDVAVITSLWWLQFGVQYLALGCQQDVKQIGKIFGFRDALKRFRLQVPFELRPTRLRQIAVLFHFGHSLRAFVKVLLVDPPARDPFARFLRQIGVPIEIRRYGCDGHGKNWK